MTKRFPTLAAFMLPANDGHTPHLPSVFGAAIYSSLMVQAFCWFLVFLL
jgi:hypothetical protein